MATIILIDADPAQTEPLQAAIEQRGHTCIVLSEGHSAIESLRQHNPDGIILSVELPQTSGYSLCNKIKRDAGLQSVPLILVSSQATAETFEEHKRLRTRADAYGHKPYDIDGTIDTLLSLIEPSQPQEPSASVEPTAQSKLANVEGAISPQAVRFGEDPSVRDISSSPFLHSDDNDAPEAIEPTDFAASTQVLSQEQLNDAADLPDEEERDTLAQPNADASGFAEEQRWVERALMGLGGEPTQAAAPTLTMAEGGDEPLTELPTRTTDPELHGEGEKDDVLEAEGPGESSTAAPDAPSNDDDIFSRPTAALAAAPEAEAFEHASPDMPPEAEEARPTEVDPPKKRRTTRGGDKKPSRRSSKPVAPIEQAATPPPTSDVGLSDDLQMAARELSRLARALDEAIDAKDCLEQRIAEMARRIARTSTQDDDRN